MWVFYWSISRYCVSKNSNKLCALRVMLYLVCQSNCQNKHMTLNTFNAKNCLALYWNEFSVTKIYQEKALPIFHSCHVIWQHILLPFVNINQVTRQSCDNCNFEKLYYNLARYENQTMDRPTFIRRSPKGIPKLYSSTKGPKICEPKLLINDW